MRHGELDFDTAIGLKELRKRIASANIPPSRLDKTFNLATWNIREFGRRKRRTPSIHYIAEILSQFDLIAITEVRSDLSDLNRVLEILGPYWDIVVSDFGMDRGGNKERIAYVFDKRMIRFTGLAAEADAPRVPVSEDGRSRLWNTADGWWRAPYMASFEAGSFDFVVIAVHIRWGAGVADRRPALRALGEWVARRSKHPFATDSDFILMGDFNIPSRRSSAYRALIGDDTGLQLPAKLANIKGTNLSQKNTYDQILPNAAGAGQKRFSNAGGVLDFYQGDWRALYPSSSHRPSSKNRFTYELSDHLPLWLQIDTDIVDPHLQKLAGV